jgi:hypothetical protein
MAVGTAAWAHRVDGGKNPDITGTIIGLFSLRIGKRLGRTHRRRAAADLEQRRDHRVGNGVAGAASRR